MVAWRKSQRGYADLQSAEDYWCMSGLRGVEEKWRELDERIGRDRASRGHKMETSDVKVHLASEEVGSALSSVGEYAHCRLRLLVRK